MRGYKEHGNINTPLELAIGDQAGRYSHAIDSTPRFRVTGSSARKALLNQQIACKESRLGVRRGCAGHRELSVAVVGRYLLLSTVSLSAVGYEHHQTEPVIPLWNETRHAET